MKNLLNKEMKEENKVKIICDKCGKRQKRDKKESNENWDVYPNVPCECGGKFKPDFTNLNK